MQMLRSLLVLACVAAALGQPCSDNCGPGCCSCPSLIPTCYACAPGYFRLYDPTTRLTSCTTSCPPGTNPDYLAGSCQPCTEAITYPLKATTDGRLATIPLFCDYLDTIQDQRCAS
jgi:hypothetical protein